MRSSSVLSTAEENGKNLNHILNLKRDSIHTQAWTQVKMDLITFFTTIHITQTQIQVVYCTQLSRGSTPGSVQKFTAHFTSTT